MSPRMTSHERVPVYGRLQEVVRKGYPEVGWRGDPLLRVEFDPIDEAWVIVDTAFPEGHPGRYVLRRKSEGLRDLDMLRPLAEKLRDGDLSNVGGKSLTNRLIARNNAIEAEKARANDDFKEEAAKRLAWAVRKDLSSSGRVQWGYGS